MKPFIEDIRPGLQPKGAMQRFWQVQYQFCSLSATISVCAEDEMDARANLSSNSACVALKVQTAGLQHF